MGTSEREHDYQIRLIRRLYSDSTTRWSALPVIYLEQETTLSPEVFIEGALALPLIVDVTPRGGEVYDELGSIL